jgi:stalled ribosome rescue protein Dom34
MSFMHAVIWLDHRHAQVIAFSPSEVDKTVVRHAGGHRQIHHRSGSVGAGHAGDDAAFFDEVVAAVGDTAEVLVVGPGTAKTGFRRHVDEHHRRFAQRIVGVEAVDHPGDGELLAFARRHFVRVDRMLGTG